MSKFLKFCTGIEIYNRKVSVNWGFNTPRPNPRQFQPWLWLESCMACVMLWRH